MEQSRVLFDDFHVLRKLLRVGRDVHSRHPPATSITSSRTIVIIVIITLGGSRSKRRLFVRNGHVAWDQNAELLDRGDERGG